MYKLNNILYKFLKSIFHAALCATTLPTCNSALVLLLQSPLFLSMLKLINIVSIVNVAIIFVTAVICELREFAHTHTLRVSTLAERLFVILQFNYCTSAIRTHVLNLRQKTLNSCSC